MKAAWVPVARWELFRILRRADFVVSILITPLLALGSGWLGQAMRGSPARIAVVWLDPDGTPRPAEHAAALAARDRVSWVSPPARAESRAALLEVIRAKRLDGAALVPAGYAAGDTVELLSRRAGPRWRAAVESALREQARLERAVAHGLAAPDLASLDRPLAVRGTSTEPPRRGGSRAERLGVFGILFLIMLVQLSTISYLMIGISGEKQARVTEVVVSAVPAQAWMDGKLVAFTVIGLIMAVVWAGSAILIAVPFGFALPEVVRPLPLLLTALFAVLGLYLYNALFAALMATLQGMQSTSKFQGYFFMLPFVPFFFLGPLMDDPDAGWIAVLSMVPLFSPSLVPARLAAGAVPAWEVALGLALLAAAAWGLRAVAGRIFRVGMLMYGKDLTLPEILRWARER
jgi:ABC-2 type transport system permease protein